MCKISILPKTNISLWGGIPIMNKTNILLIKSNEIYSFDSINNNWNEMGESISFSTASNAVEIINSIHIILNGEYHYSYNGNWTLVSKLPKHLTSVKCVTINNVLHVFGYSQYMQYRYKYIGEWREASTPLPFNKYGIVVSINDTIHMMGGSWKNYHTIFNKKDWEEAEELLPFEIDLYKDAFVFVKDNSINVLIESENGFDYYKLNGNKWTLVSKLPFDLSGQLVVAHNKVHLLGDNHIILDI